ncbi:hypothetical protein E2C01_072973 [Portunus trituberculatus]|uniref:Uncharacterized protein n=1 Tax=Portunus trituberculatus TaxID=210409 RepID=A0A5B7I9C1_PORTR|nr:hypothetical protein [Portunus trituberculatus]
MGQRVTKERKFALEKKRTIMNSISADLVTLGMSWDLLSKETREEVHGQLGEERNENMRCWTEA